MGIKFGAGSIYVMVVCVRVGLVECGPHALKENGQKMGAFLKARIPCIYCNFLRLAHPYQSGTYDIDLDRQNQLVSVPTDKKTSTGV